MEHSSSDFSYQPILNCNFFQLVSMAIVRLLLFPPVRNQKVLHSRGSKSFQQNLHFIIPCVIPSTGRLKSFRIRRFHANNSIGNHFWHLLLMPATINSDETIWQKKSRKTSSPHHHQHIFPPLFIPTLRQALSDLAET